MLWFVLFRPGATGFAFRFTAWRSLQMTRCQAKPYSDGVKHLMAEKSRLLSNELQAFSEMGLDETARPVWLAPHPMKNASRPCLR